MPPGAIAALVLKSALGPLAAGMVVRAVSPMVAKRLERVVNLIVKLLMPASIVTLLVAALPAMWAFIGSSTVLAMAMFTVAGLAIGHLLGGPDPDHAVVLGLSTACRHPAIAFGFASANFPQPALWCADSPLPDCQRRHRHSVCAVAQSRGSRSTRSGLAHRPHIPLDDSR